MSNYRLWLLPLVFCTLSLHGQQISGIFRPTDARMEYIEKEDWPTFVERHQALQAEKYRLTSVQTTGIGADRRFWGIMTESILSDTLMLLKSWPEMVKAKRAMAAKGWLLTTVQGYAVNDTDAHYVAVWQQDPDKKPHKIWKLDTPESVSKKTEAMAAQQFYLQNIEVFTSATGAATYLAIYHYDPLPVRNYLQASTSKNQFDENFQQRINSEVRLTDLELYQAKEARYWLGVYKPGQYDYRILFNLPHADFNGKWDEMERENFKLVNWEVRD